MTDILQSSLPVSPWSDPRLSRLPGVLPLDPADWIVIDEAYAGQMTLRDGLIRDRRDEVIRIHPDAVKASQEVLDRVLDPVTRLPGFKVDEGAITRPDGMVVALDRSDPLAVAGRLVQEDLCIMQLVGAEYLLTAAVLCFPAGWMLAEKFMRPLIGIHGPVPSYDENIARRVQRLFDAIRPERPLWRANAHFWDKPTLFAPRSEADARTPAAHPAPFIRSERQCLLRLPESGAVLFSIHTVMVRAESLTREQAETLDRVRGHR